MKLENIKNGYYILEKEINLINILYDHFIANVKLYG